MPNGVKIDADIFADLDHAEQNTILFKNTERILTTLVCTKKECDDRMECIEKTAEKRKVSDRVYSTGGGVIGGIIAVLGTKLF